MPLATIALFASQLALGRWQTDEYQLFATERTLGWHALLPRLAYSPRPLSEAVLFAYGQAVLLLQRPLIGSFLVLLWGAVIAGAAACAFVGAPLAVRRTSAPFAIPAAIFAFMLAGGQITEAFYWPMAAAAYLPTAAGATALVFLATGSGSRAMRVASFLALLTCALSSEVGASLAIGFGLGACLDRLAGARQGAPRPEPGILWWAVPGLAGLVVFAVILSDRAGMDELGAAAHPATGHPLLAALLALRFLALDVVDRVDRPATQPILLAFADRLAFAAAIALLWRAAGAAWSWRRAVPVVAALAFAAFFSLFAAYLHYGDACCERQATTRQWMIELLLILAASFLPLLRRFAARPGAAGPAVAVTLLAASLLAPLARDIPGFAADAGARSLALQARAKTWASGLLEGTRTMEFYLPPDGADLLVRGTAQPIGAQTVASGEPADMVDAVGHFFGKTTVFTCEPWQTRLSYVLNGSFIPACPPHPGLPDVVDATSRRLGFRAATDPREPPQGGGVDKPPQGVGSDKPPQGGAVR